MLLGLEGQENRVRPYLVHGIICQKAEFQSWDQIVSRGCFGFLFGTAVIASLEA